MRNIILLTAVVLMGVMGGNTLSAQKFGYLNSQAILAELPEVKQSEAELEALQKQLQKSRPDCLVLTLTDKINVTRQLYPVRGPCPLYNKQRGKLAHRSHAT